jgi:Spy/CpxP family protein refolding chaperone
VKRIVLLSIGLLILATGAVAAQATDASPPVAPTALLAVQAEPAPVAEPEPVAEPAPPAPPADALFSIRGNLYPAELVMRHQKAIALQPDQKDAIRDAIREAELKFLDLKWEVQDASESLREILGEKRIEEAEALDLLGKILAVEGEIKRTQFTLMIRIKNILTLDQQLQLQKLRQHGMMVPVAPARPGML